MSEPNERDAMKLCEDALASLDKASAIARELYNLMDTSAPPAMPEDEALDFEHFWQIVIGWSQDMPRVGQKLSVHEMRTLTERLVSISAAALRSRQPSTAADEPSADYPPGKCKYCGAPVPYHYGLCVGAARPSSTQGEDDDIRLIACNIVGGCSADVPEDEKIDYAEERIRTLLNTPRARLSATTKKE